MPSRDFDTALWNDKFVRRLPPNGKLLFIFLWTNDMCTSSGLYEIDPDVVTLKTGLAEEIWRQVLPQLEPKVIFYSDDDREVVWIKNFFRRQCKNPMFASSALGSLRNMPRDLAEQWLKYNGKTLKRYKIPIQSIDRPKTVEEQSKDSPKTVSEQSKDSPDYGDSLETVSRQTGSPTTRSDQIRSDYPSDNQRARKKPRSSDLKDPKATPHVSQGWKRCAKCHVEMPQEAMKPDERGYCQRCQWEEEATEMPEELKDLANSEDRTADDTETSGSDDLDTLF